MQKGNQFQANVLWDNCSTISYITHECAKKLKLKGRPCKVSVNAFGNAKSEHDSIQYKLYAWDAEGERVPFDVVGVPIISRLSGGRQQKRIANSFTETKDKINSTSSVDKPNDIDILIGYDYAGYHPVPERSKDHKVLLKNRFGYIAAGSSRTKESLDSTVMHADTYHVTHNIDKFMDVESLGVRCIPLCGRCKCGKCHPGGKPMTIEDEDDYELICSKITFNQQRGRWEAAYPWKEDPSRLPYNKSVAMAVLKSLEKRLKGVEHQGELYCKEMRRMSDSGVAREISNEELESYKGTKYFLTHHPIWKPESKSTPCRPVFNSSKKYKNVAMNDLLAKGPSLLNKLPGVLLRFRRGKIAFAGDISKMFNCIDIPKEDQMLHLFLWRNMEENVEPRVYAITTVNMGDRPSATIAQAVLRKTAEKEAERYPIETSIIRDNSYMDDIMGSVDTIEEATAIIKNIDMILKNAGFNIKEWILSYMATHPTIGTDVVEQLEKILGVQFRISNDTLIFDEHTLPKIPEGQTTKRMILATVNKIFDPIGLLGAFIVKFKILLREIWGHEEKFDWDDILPESIQRRWQELKEEIEMVMEIEFTRALTPDNAAGRPKLIMLSDGSGKAFGAVAYARWETDKGIVMRLIASKCRVAPLKLIDIVRIELCGGLLSARLRTFILEECDMKFESIHHFVDSEIVKSYVGKKSYGFGTFEGNRLGEIERTTLPEEWLWIPGVMNVADLMTRGCSPNKMGKDSIWQNCHPIFKEAESVWSSMMPPTPNMELSEHSPAPVQDTLQAIGNVCIPDSLASRIDITRYSNYTKLLHVTARILLFYQPPPAFKNAVGDITLQNVEEAEIFWIKEAQGSITDEELKSRYIRLGPKRRCDGIITVGHRMEKWMDMSYNNKDIILLPYDHPISKLYVLEKHNLLHLSGYTGASATACKVRLKFWIPHLENMIKSIKSKCVGCKQLNLDRLKESQAMASLPIDRLKPAPPWHSTTVDLFGPIEIKGEVNKRSRGKAFGIIFTCNLTRATHIDVASSYSTDSFLAGLRRFLNIRRNPAIMRSDKGSQLTSANNELKKMILGLDNEQIKRFGLHEGFEWKFSPADAPWYNGCAESMVKVAKKALTASLHGHVPTILELLTVFYEVSNLLNERPIGKQSRDIEDGTYLCPNDLLIGGSNKIVPKGPFKPHSTAKERLNFIQAIVDSFWIKMTRSYFPSLIIEQKWHTDSRNVCIGDIVMVQDSNVVRGEWKMARISKVHPSSDGKVRKVTLCYRQLNNSPHYKGGEWTEIERPVQRIVVILPFNET